MKTTIQQTWYETRSGKAYTVASDNYGTDWREAHSSALFRILRAAENGASIKVHSQDGENADWTAIYPEGYSCHYTMRTTED